MRGDKREIIQKCLNENNFSTTDMQWKIVTWTHGMPGAWGG
jgi:hypothetical protein